MDIQLEIENAYKISITNESELNLVKEKYFSREGILPRVYKLALDQDGKNSDKILKKLVLIRAIIDSKIKEYNQNFI